MQNRMMKKLGIYMIGNLGSRVLAYLIVLIYTYYISPTDLGYYDVVLTTISFLVPVIMFEINEGVYRFLLSENAEGKKRVLASGGIFLTLTLLITIFAFFIANRLLNIRFHLLIILLLISQATFIYTHETVRGLENSTLYAYSGVFQSILMLSIEIVGLMIFNLGIEILFIGLIASYFISSVLLVIVQRELRIALFGTIRFFDIELLKKILCYSAPLVPDVISWWCINSSDRYIILYYLGTNYNGLYSMANKFPTIITAIGSIFYLAWQETAIREYESDNRDSFFSKVFNQYTILLLTLCICAFPVTKIIFTLFVGKAYRTAWIYSGFLYIGAVFKVLNDFLSLGYQITKETSKSMVTTLVAAIINILINILLVDKIGLHAASLSTFIAFFILFIIRLIQTKKYFTLDIAWKRIIILFVICIISFIYVVFCYSLVILAIIFALEILFALAFNRSMLRETLKRKGK